MHLEFLVEEPSAEIALQNLVPLILGEDATFSVHSYGDKPRLLRRLPSRLRGYGHWLPSDWRVTVLVDCDSDDCLELKAELERMAREASLTTKTAAGQGGTFHVLNRIAVEELEAWFFGDVEAIVAAYGGVPPTLGSRARYSDPDHVPGGTWEALERVLQDAGHHCGGLAKIAAARDISSKMDPERNRSRSFQIFRDGLRQAVWDSSR